MSERKDIPAPLFEKLVDRYVYRGEPLIKLAPEAGVSVPTLSKKFKEAGITVRSKGRIKGKVYKNQPRERVPTEEERKEESSQASPTPPPPPARKVQQF